MDKFVIRTKVGDLAKKEVGIKISSPKKKRRRIEKDVITTDPGSVVMTSTRSIMHL